MPESSILTPDQLRTFDARGVVRLPAFYPEAAIERMAESLWADLERRFGMIRGRPESWTVVTPAHFDELKRGAALDGLGSPGLAQVADALLGADAWDAPKRWGWPLVTFPSPAPTLRRPPWHLDIGGGDSLASLPILRTFTFLAPLAPGGGGTLYLAGSHGFARQMEREQGRPVRSARVRKRLQAEHPWLARLLAADSLAVREFLNVEVRVDGHALRLEEMTGAPGDLIIMHPGALHASSHNSLDRPRMMLTSSVHRRGGAADAG